jgi:putative transposase
MRALQATRLCLGAPIGIDAFKYAFPSMPTYAVTTVTYQRRALFQRTASSELLLSILFGYRERRRYRLHGFAIMPEHLHALLTPDAGQTIERCVQCIKGGFSFQVRRQFSGEVWQTGFHEHRIRDEEDFQNQLTYIAANPERRHLMDHRFCSYPLSRSD